MPKHPVSLWLIAERKRHGWKAEEVARRLRDAGIEAQDTTYRVWEAGRKPKADAIRAMETLFGSKAPGEPEPSGQPDLAALLAAMTEQSRQQAQLITLLTEQNAMLKQLVFERPAAPGHSLTAPASLQAAESAALELGALDLRTEQERDQPAEPRAGAPRGTERSGTHPR